MSGGFLFDISFHKIEREPPMRHAHDGTHSMDECSATLLSVDTTQH